MKRNDAAGGSHIDNGGRLTHLTGHVPRELAKHALSLLGGFPDMELLSVFAAKL